MEGDIHAVKEIDAEYNIEIVDNGGLVGSAQMDLPIEENVNLINVECFTVMEDLGEVKRNLRYEWFKLKRIIK